MRLLVITALTIFTLISVGAVPVGATAAIGKDASFAVAAGDATSSLSNDRGAGSAEIRAIRWASSATGGAAAGWNIEADRAYLAASHGGAEVPIPAAGQLVFFHTDWFVSGSGSPGTYFMRALLDGATFCTGSTTIESGGFTIWCNDGWRATSGSHTLRWELDYTNAIAESNEGDNSVSRTWTTGSLLDIEAVDAFLRTAPNGGDEVTNPALGQAVFFHLRLRVTGIDGDVTVPLRALVDETVFCSGDVAVHSGTTVLWCNEAWTATEGEHTLRWELDSNDVVAETDELNNAVSTQWRTSAGETPEPTNTDAPAATATPTRTPTGVVVSPTPTPTGTVLAYEGFFARGDADCSLTLSAADVVAHARAFGGDSVCDNDDCDRDGSITEADVGCAARCLFGICPVPPHASQVTAVVPESAPGIVPFSTIRVSGINFGSGEKPQSVSIGGQHGEVAGSDEGDMLVVVPDLAPGTYDLAFSDGDVAGAPLPVTIAAAHPIGTPDTFEGLTALVADAVSLILDLDLEATYGDNAPIVRRELEAFHGEFAAAVAEMLSTPGFEDLRAPLDAAIEGSGLPEQLRESVAALEATQAGSGGAAALPVVAEATRQVATVIYVAGRTTVFAATRVLPVAAAAPAAPAIGAALVVAAKVIVVGTIVVAVVGTGVLLTQDTPVIGAYEPPIVEPGQLLTVHGWGFGGLVQPNLVLLFKQSGATMKVRDAEEAGEDWLKFRIPDAVGACGPAEMYLEVPLIGTRAPGNLPLQIRPVLVEISASSVQPLESFRMQVRGVTGCSFGAESYTYADTVLQQTEGDKTRWETASTRQISGQPKWVETRVEPVVPGSYDVFLEMEGLESNRKRLIIDTDIDKLVTTCARTELTIGERLNCHTRPVGGRVTAFPMGNIRLDYSASQPDLLEVRPSDFVPGDVFFVGRRPGTALIDVTLYRADIDPPRRFAESSESLELTVIEKNAPTITLQRDTPEIVEPGATIQVTAKAEDDFEMQKIVLEAEGDAVLDGDRRKEYECPLFGIPGVNSRKCEKIFLVQLKETGFRPGPITVSATAVDGSNNEGTSNELQFRFELGEVTGTVFDAKTGDPVQDVILQLLDDTGAVFDTIASGGGGFLFEDVLAGNYTLTAAANGFEPGEEQVVVEAEQTTQVDLFLQPVPVGRPELRRLFGRQLRVPGYEETTFDAFEGIAISDSGIAFIGRFRPQFNDERGVFAFEGGAARALVDGSTVIPGTEADPKHFRRFGLGLSMDGEQILFSSGDSGGNIQGDAFLTTLTSTPATGVERVLAIADIDKAIYSLLLRGDFLGGTLSTPRVEVVLTPLPASAGTFEVLASTNTAIPGGVGNFTGFASASFELVDGVPRIAFTGAGEGSQQGVYTVARGGPVDLVADTNTSVPDGRAKFLSPCRTALDGDRVAFVEESGFRRGGIYTNRGGGLSRVADTSTPVPGGDGVFTEFNCSVGFDAGIIAFWSKTPDGVFADVGGQLVPVVVEGDVVDGNVVRSTTFGGEEWIDGRDLLVWVDFDGFDDDGYYLATFR